MSTSVLLVEDDDLIAPLLIQMLERSEYAVVHVRTGADAISHVAEHSPQVVLLDLGLPDMDGLDVCRQLRADGFDGGIVVLTARDGELDRVVGFDVGADDYLAKPFSLSELLARLRAVMRRGWAAPVGAASAAPSAAPTAAPAPAAGSAGDSGLEVDTRGRRVRVRGEEVAVTAKEFDVLALLDQERGAVVTRERLMDEVWDENWFGSTKTLDATVGRLRQKLEAADSPVAVGTVRGVGFRLEDA